MARRLASLAEIGVLALCVVLALIASFHVLPPALLALPAFTLGYLAVFGTATARLLWTYRRQRRASFDRAGARRVWVILISGALSAPLLLTGVVLGSIYLNIPFWPPDEARAYAAEAQRTDAPPDRSIYLIKHTWHTSVSLRVADLTMEDWPDPEIHAGTWVDFGWGDAIFFRAPVGSVPMALDALFLPGPAVMHVASYDPAPGEYFSGRPVVRLPVTEAALRRLSAFLLDSYARGPGGLAIPLGPGYYGEVSHYAAATGTYYFPNTCNVWTAQALRTAGVPVTAEVAITAENLTFQAARLGELVR